MSKEIVETENFTLAIFRGQDSVTLEYKPKGYWTEVVTGSIRRHFLGGDSKEFSTDISHSSGGNKGDWAIENALDFAASLTDCVNRLKDMFDVETARMKAEHEEHMAEIRAESERLKILREEVKLANPVLSRESIATTVKELFKQSTLGETATAHYTFITRGGELSTFMIENRGSKRFYMGQVSHPTQKSLVESLIEAKVVALKII